MRMMLTSREAKDVVRSHISYFESIYCIHLCFMVISFFLNSLATNICYENLLLIIHSWHIYKHTDIGGSEEGSNLNFSATTKKGLYSSQNFSVSKNSRLKHT